jgi:hypothetical protein
MIDLTKVKMVKAQSTDFELLTEISFAAKRHWDYPDSYYDLWKETYYKNIKKINLLKFYSNDFNTVEINYTFYRIK